MIAHVFGTLALVAVALLFGATWYEAVVMAPNYERDVPASAREWAVGNWVRGILLLVILLALLRGLLQIAI